MLPKSHPFAPSKTWTANSKCAWNLLEKLTGWFRCPFCICRTGRDLKYFVPLALTLSHVSSRTDLFLCQTVLRQHLIFLFGFLKFEFVLYFAPFVPSKISKVNKIRKNFCFGCFQSVRKENQFGRCFALLAVKTVPKWISKFFFIHFRRGLRFLCHFLVLRKGTWFRKRKLGPFPAKTASRSCDSEAARSRSGPRF